MKELILILLITYSVRKLDAQRIELILIPIEVEGKWGYVNYKDSLIVEPIYEEAYPTYDLRGRIKQKGKYGYINEKGEIIIRPKYDYAEDFKFGVAKVTKWGKIKYINTDDKENKQSIALCGGIYRQCIQTKNFVGIDTFKQNNKYFITISKAIRENGKLNYYPDTLNSTFEKVSTLGRQYIILENEGKKALFFDQRGYPSSEYVDSTLNLKYDEFKFFACQENKIETHEIFGYRVNEKWGYIRLSYTPEEIIEPKYLEINSMERGIALVEYERGKFGYVNQYGKEYFKRN